MTKPAGRIPTCRVTVEADATVSLDEFEDSEIAEYLRQRGYFVSGSRTIFNDQEGDSPNILDPDELDHIETLLVCGQMDAAKSEALALIGSAIGRTLQ
jgi:hypothetical protein